MTSRAGMRWQSERARENLPSLQVLMQMLFYVSQAGPCTPGMDRSHSVTSSMGSWNARTNWSHSLWLLRWSLLSTVPCIAITVDQLCGPSGAPTAKTRDLLPPSFPPLAEFKLAESFNGCSEKAAISFQLRLREGGHLQLTFSPV